MKTPLPYHGGKSRLASWIVSKMPRHTVYVEPFFGGGAVFFAKPVPAVTNNHHYREVINDHDERIVELFRALQDPTQHARLVERLAYTPYARSEYDKAKVIFQGRRNGFLAWAVAVAFLQGFGNKALGGWAYARCTANGPASFQAAKASIRDAAQRLQRTFIDCDDALSVIKRWDSPQTLFYCDPPYPKTEQGHYAGYTVDDFRRLVETLNQCQGAFLLSCFPMETGIPIGPLVSVYQRVRKTGHSANGRTAERRCKTELLYYKPRTGELRPELARVMAQPCFDVFQGDEPAAQAEPDLGPQGNGGRPPEAIQKPVNGRRWAQQSLFDVRSSSHG